MSGRDITVHDPAKLAPDERRVARGFWRKLPRVLSRIPFADDLLAAYYCAVDAETPTYVKAILMGAVAYFVLPTDLLPDFIAVLGFADDASVLVTAMTTVGGHIREPHRDKAKATLARLAAKDVSPAPASP